MSDLDQLCVNTLRFLAVDSVEKAKSGHPGLPLGAAPMAYQLWTRHLKVNPRDPQWFDRDRFVLSAGHGSALLYALLHLAGFAVSLDDLRQFRQWGSRTPGHPERGHTPGVEVTTGPLGQGFANAVGMAIAEAHLAHRYNRPGHEIVDHMTYVLASDGDLMEGVASEAASLAGHLRLGKLICLYDDNRVTLSAGTDMTFTEDRGARFAAYGWQVLQVADGNDLDEIDAALCAARALRSSPSLIAVRTHLGFGSPNRQDSFKAHGSPLGPDETLLTKRALNWPAEPAFLVPPPVIQHIQEAVGRHASVEADWSERLCRYARDFPELAHEFETRRRGDLQEGWAADMVEFAADAKGVSTRVASGQVMNAIAPRLPALCGGSADLDPSTETALKGAGDFNPVQSPQDDAQGSAGGGWSDSGRNLHFGVREHAMGSIANGMAAHGGFIPYCATFLIFSDYMRPPIRLAALMHLHVVFVFTHDSIALGEDGPTHQPIEQLAALRAIPGITVIRPGDANETEVAWRVALETRGPVVLVLSRQALPTLDRSRYSGAQGLVRGAYVLSDAVGEDPQLTLIASGSEVALIVAAAERLESEGIRVRCVSMPSWELFDTLAASEQERVLQPGKGVRLAVEAGSPQGWHRYLGEGGAVMGIERFGASAPGPTLLREYGFSVDAVCARARALLSPTG